MQPHFRFRRQEPVFRRPKTRARTLTNPKPNNTILQLPAIYTKDLRVRVPQLHIDNQIAVRREIGKIVSFKKDRIPCLLPELYEQLPQKMKSVNYSSLEYQQKLGVVNKILGSCDLNVKEREIMVARGQLSSAIYIFFTNFIYHPISLCCDQPVVLKCIEKNGIEVEKVKDSNKWHFLCINCLKILLKINEGQQKSEKQGQTHIKQRKLLDFALHIASGRYKKYLLEEDPATLSYQHIKSRFKYSKPRKITQSHQV